VQRMCKLSDESERSDSERIVTCFAARRHTAELAMSLIGYTVTRVSDSLVRFSKGSLTTAAVTSLMWPPQRLDGRRG